MLITEHCDCCGFTQQSPPYNRDGICPKCKTKGRIKGLRDLYCLACGSYVDCPDKSVSELYGIIADERRRSERYREVIDSLTGGMTSTGLRRLDRRLLAILRGDEDD